MKYTETYTNFSGIDVKMEIETNQGVMTVTTVAFWGKKTLNYQIVDNVPEGYEMWDILSLPEGYAALCKIIPGDLRTVDINTLRAIKIEDAPKGIAKAAAKTHRHKSNIRRVYKAVM